MGARLGRVLTFLGPPPTKGAEPAVFRTGSERFRGSCFGFTPPWSSALFVPLQRGVFDELDLFQAPPQPVSGRFSLDPHHVRPIPAFSCALPRCSFLRCVWWGAFPFTLYAWVGRQL